MNKRGLSTIVIILIMILLSLAAIGIVWFVVQNILSKGAHQVGLGQFLINLDITNAREQSGNILVNIMRNTGKGELVKIKFILSDGINSEILEQASNLSELETGSFSLHPTELISTNIKNVSVAPVFRTEDGSEATGTITDTYTIGTSPEQQQQQQGGGYCGDNKCEPAIGETAEICPGDCGSSKCTANCGTRVCGLDPVCGQKCGEDCPTGEMCQEGICIEIHAVNIGTVQNTWPPGSEVYYFGSSNLPSDTSYRGYYIKFPGSEETSCLLIAIYQFPLPPGYLNSHIGFNFPALIKTGDNYQIWKTLEECQSS